MKNGIRYLKTALLVLLSNLTAAQTIGIKVTVTDALTNQPVAFCSIRAINSNISTIASANGSFTVDVPQQNKTLLIILSSAGYATDTIELNGHQLTYFFKLLPETGILNDVVVSGSTKATRIKENPLALQSISLKQIEQSAENNIIDTIAKNTPGFSTVKTGPNVSKPFINGLGYNRVLTLYDGMRVETQQWGDEHGVPVDDYIIEKAEMIKGPASLMYGSDAIAGVLSLFSATAHKTDKKLHGKYLSEYQTNNGLIGNSLRLEYGQKSWNWLLTASQRVAKNYANPIDGRVYNTGFTMKNTSAFIRHNGKTGYSSLNATFYDNTQGIPDGSRDSLTRQFTKQVFESAGENTIQPSIDNIKARPIVNNSTLNSYTLSPLHQRIQDYRVYTDHFYRLGHGDLKLFAGFEQNIRREFSHPTNVQQAGVYIELNTINYSLRYNAPAFLNIESSAGVTGMYQHNRNSQATSFPIPDYTLADAGMYGFAKWKYKKWTIAGGIRFDHRTEKGREMYIKANPATGFFTKVGATDTAGAIKQFSPFTLYFRGFSGSIGFTYQINSNIGLKFNIGRGYRSPNITEIASNGLDPGAHIVYIGNLNFVPEFSLQEDIGILGDFKNVSFSLTAFNNNIQHFIYEAQQVDANGNPVVIIAGNKTFQFQQTNAHLYGLDATLLINPERLKAFHFTTSFAFVEGFNLNPVFKHAGVNGRYLPFIPPARLFTSVEYDIKTGIKILKALTIKAEADVNATQNKYLGLYGTETSTPGYALINIAANTHLQLGKTQVIQLQIAVNNLFNIAWQSHLSRLQYFEYYTQSPNGRTGIYDMGRNICFKTIIPF